MEHVNQNRRIRLGNPHYLRRICGEYYENDQKRREKTGLSWALHVYEGDKRRGYSKIGRNKDRKKRKNKLFGRPVHKLDVTFVM